MSSAGLPAQADRATRLQRLGPIDGGSSFSADLLAYRHAGLRLFASVAVPLTLPPLQGYPVLATNHRFHPDPPRLGIRPEGREFTTAPMAFAHYAKDVAVC